MDVSPTLARALVAACLVGSVVGFASWLRPTRRRLCLLSEALGLLCLITCLTAWTLRWFAAGHLPLFGTYEGALSLSLLALLASLVVRQRLRMAGGPWAPALVVVAALLGHALGYDTEVHALTISERSLVVDAHALLAWAAFGALAANAGLALRRLLVRAECPPGLDRSLARWLSLGFLFHSAMLASGSLYEFLLFGRAWSFDPIESLGLVAWFAYGTVLHLHLLAGWEGRRLAGWCLALFVLLIVSYRAVACFPAGSSYHLFDLDRRMHVVGPPAAQGRSEP